MSVHSVQDLFILFHNILFDALILPALQNTEFGNTVWSMLPTAWHKSVLFTAHKLAYMEIFTEMEKNG